MSLTIVILAVLSFLAGICIGVWIGYTRHQRTLREHLMEHLRDLERSAYSTQE